MNASEFARKRAKIERRSGNRPAFLRKAMAHLEREADAVRVTVRGQMVGWAMTDGSVVCVKVRFRDEVAASGELGRIGRYARNEHVPVRAYRCDRCEGWHLTSQAERPSGLVGYSVG